MVKRKQHTVSLSDDERKSINDAAGLEGFSPYVRRKMLQTAAEKNELNANKKNDKRK